MTIKILKNALVFDGINEELLEGASVVIEDDRIREVSSGETTLKGAEVIDLKGKFLMPGLLDLHFHAYSISFDMRKLDHMPKPLMVSHSIRLLEGALQRGFTTVRDPGGGDVGLRLATEAGLIEGDKRGRWIWYRLGPSAVDDLAGSLGAIVESSAASA